PNRWMLWVGASVLAATAAFGAVAWYERAQAVNREAAAVPPPGPALVAPSAAVPRPNRDPGVPQTSQHAEAVHPSPETPASTPAAAPPAAVAPAAVPGARGGYTILVASFKSPESGQRVVEELTNAGFRARAVERDGGPERGRFTLVLVSGYTSANDVQRDLQQI